MTSPELAAFEEYKERLKRQSVVTLEEALEANRLLCCAFLVDYILYLLTIGVNDASAIEEKVRPFWEEFCK